MAISSLATQGETASGLRKMSTASSMSITLHLLKPANGLAEQPHELKKANCSLQTGFDLRRIDLLAAVSTSKASATPMVFANKSI